MGSKACHHSSFCTLAPLYYGDTTLSRRVHPSSHSFAMLCFFSSSPLSEICHLHSHLWSGPFILLVSSALEPAASVPAIALRTSLTVPEIFAFWSPERRENGLHVCQRFLCWSLITPRAMFYLMRLSIDTLIAPITPAIVEISPILCPAPPTPPLFCLFWVLSPIPLPQDCFSCHPPSWFVNSLLSLGLGTTAAASR